MKFLKFTSLVALSFCAMFGIWFAFKAVAGEAFTAVSISPNAATAGAYSMETVVSALATVLVLSRLMWAIGQTQTVKEAFSLLHTKTGILAISLGGIIALGFKNRVFWWVKHIFTDEAYFHVDFEGTVNSILISTLICLVVYSINSDTDEKSKIPRALWLWLFGCLCFVAGTAYYMLAR